MRAVLLLIFAAVTLSAQATPWQGFTALAISPDGTSIATGGREGEVLWWETSTGELLFRWVKPGSGPVVALAFSPDSQLGVVLLDGSFVVALPDNAVLKSISTPTWGSLTGALARWKASGPLNTSFRVTGSNLWAQGSPEGTISVGNLGGQTLATWPAHRSAVTGLALTPDGTVLISCSYDGTLARWNPLTGESLGTLQSLTLDARLSN